MGQVTRLPNAGNAPRVTATQEAGAIIVRVEAPPAVQAPDELVAFPFGFEPKTASALVRKGTLTAAKIGRRLYAKRSDVVALVDKLAPKRPEPVDDVEAHYAALVTHARKVAR